VYEHAKIGRHRLRSDMGYAGGADLCTSERKDGFSRRLLRLSMLGIYEMPNELATVRLGLQSKQTRYVSWSGWKMPLC